MTGTGWRAAASAACLAQASFLTFQAGGVDTTTTFLRRTTPGVSVTRSLLHYLLPVFVSGSVQDVFLHS
jgi:hypothetical protein